MNILFWFFSILCRFHNALTCHVDLGTWHHVIRGPECSNFILSLNSHCIISANGCSKFQRTSLKSKQTNKLWYWTRWGKENKPSSGVQLTYRMRHTHTSCFLHMPIVHSRFSSDAVCFELGIMRSEENVPIILSSNSYCIISANGCSIFQRISFFKQTLVFTRQGKENKPSAGV